MFLMNWASFVIEQSFTNLNKNLNELEWSQYSDSQYNEDARYS